MLGIDRKAIFSNENIYLYSLWYLVALKTLNTRAEVILSEAASWSQIFRWKMFACG